jgi:hypothetical protein
LLAQFTADSKRVSDILETSLASDHPLMPEGRTQLIKALNSIISDNAAEFHPGDAVVLISDGDMTPQDRDHFLRQWYS